MRYLLITILSVFLISFSCNNKQENKVENAQIVVEDFDIFYQKFSTNSEFRKLRTVLPFKYKMIDENDNQITKEIDEFLVKLDKSKWKEKVIFEFSDKQKEPVILSISIEDTGYLIQIRFARKDNNWYAIDAENLSD